MIGPVQPIAIEAAAEVTYPAPESSAVAVQQVLGNLISAAFFPIMMTLKDPQTNSMENGVWALWGLEIAVLVFYWTFNGQFKRMEAEAAHYHGHEHEHMGHSHGYGHGHLKNEEISPLITTEPSPSPPAAAPSSASLSSHAHDLSSLTGASSSSASAVPRYGAT
jgi:hypothetical protein